jgi:hypothetical protein
MKLRTILHPLALTAVVALWGVTGFTQAVSAAGDPDNLRAVLETLRSDVNGYKIRVLNQALELTASEADKFWPIYRQYEQDLARIADKKVALLKEFGARSANGTLDNAAADKMTRQWLANAQGRLNLWKKYQKKIAKAVSPARAAQFLQVEHQMALFMDLNIAEEMPPLRAVIKSGT